MATLDSPIWRFLEKMYPAPNPPPRVREKPMQVLCVGLPRSGTESLQKALLRLGYDHTYHGWDMLFENPHRMKGWVNLARRKFYGSNDGDCHISAQEFDALLGHSVAVTDAAASCFAPELIAAYPDAKVVLNMRDLDKWHASATKNLCDAVNDHWFKYLLTWFHPTLWWMYHCHQRTLWPRLFRCPGSSLRSGVEVSGKWIYREHCAMIRGLVPKDRLLEWRIEDGWEPLCKFLGKDIPNEPFPRANDAAGFQNRIEGDLDRQGLIALINIAIFLSLLVGVGYFSIRLFS